MNDSQFAETTSKLVTFLEKERVAVLRGDFKTLENLGAEKEKMIALLGSLDVPKPELRRIQAMLSRNKALLEASSMGIRSVSERLAQLRSASAPIKTYSEQGRQKLIGEGNTKVEWRA